MTHKLVVAAVLALLAGSPASAHGPAGHGDHKPEAAYGVPGDPANPSRDVVVRMKEADGRMLFEPSRIEVRTGEQIKFRLENVGELDHEFLVGTAQEIEEHADMMKAMPDMKHDDANAKQVAAKKQGELVWHFTKTGEFDFACLIPGHLEAGMKGKIIVK